MKSKEQAIARMREKGLRLTAQRMAVLDYLCSTDEHPSARKIFENVRKSLPRVALSTVYGILAELSRNHIIKALEFSEMENRYEATLSQHINLVCLRCGKISDYLTPYTIDLDRIRETARFRALQSRFELHGICESCGGRDKKEETLRFLEPLQKKKHPTSRRTPRHAPFLGKAGARER